MIVDNLNVLSIQGAVAIVLTAVSFYISWLTRSKSRSNSNKVNLDNKLANQSYMLDEKEGIRSSQFVKKGPLVDIMMGELSTLHEVFQHGLQIAQDSPCLGWRETATSSYQWFTYAETYALVTRLGSGLLTLESFKLSDIVGISIYASNCVEWAIIQQACSTFSITLIPLYDTLGDNTRKYILDQTRVPTCVCDTVIRARKIIADLTDETCVRHIIVIQPEDQLEDLRLAAGDLAKVYSFKDILDLGTENAEPASLPRPEDLHLICYTSGTTALAKGVMITHRMIVSVIAGFDIHLQEVNMVPGDVYLSFLPLAHAFEQIVMHYLFGRGCAIGMYGGDLRNLSNDILELRPTLMCAVPRVLLRLHSTVQAAIANSPFKKWLLKTALKAKMQYVREGIVTRNTLWDKLALKPIQDRMGGRLRFLACGSAPISEDVYQFCRAALGIHTFEAYGLTETCGALLMTLGDDYVCGHVGTPMPCTTVKLCDVPDMDVIVSRDGAGEICVKGSSCTAGYYKDKKRSMEVIDSDGWLHTGDIGKWTERGCIQLIDRCKNIFKLAQGEYVSPEKVELVYSGSLLVDHVFVGGDSVQIFAIAIVVPNIKALVEALANQENNKGTILQNGSLAKLNERKPEEICQRLDARLIVLRDLIRLGKLADLKGYEQAKSVYLTSEEFTIESGLLTPTQKKVRNVFRKVYKTQIDDMYAKGMLV